MKDDNDIKRVEDIVRALNNCKEFYDAIVPWLILWQESSSKLHVDTECVHRIRLIISQTGRAHPITAKMTKSLGWSISNGLWNHYKEEVLNIVEKEKEVLSTGPECSRKEIEAIGKLNATFIDFRWRGDKDWTTGTPGGQFGWCWDTHGYRVNSSYIPDSHIPKGVVVENKEKETTEVKEDKFKELKEAHRQGKRIQCRNSPAREWLTTNKPDYSAIFYRIHPDDVEENEKGPQKKESVIKVGDTVRITNDRQIYTTINNTHSLNWPSDFIKQAAGKSAWGYWYPKNGDLGEVIHVSTHVNRDVPVLLLDIGSHIVPISESGVEKVSESINAAQPKETEIMKSIKIETQTNIVVNGNVANADKYSDEEIFDLIVGMEAAIEKLEKTKNQPKKLKAEIERMNNEIKALVAFVDGREVK